MVLLNVLILFIFVGSMVFSYRPIVSRVYGKRLKSFRSTCLSNMHKGSINLIGNSKRVCPPTFSNEANEKHFEFNRLEGSIYDWWEKNGMFKPEYRCKIDNKQKPFVVPMPPPNVTGYLHMGHAIFVALQDIMTRFNRMKGVPTLWLPGTDHAGIATQLLVERKLSKDGITRHELGREEFLRRVWDWKTEKGGYITTQMRRLGASADWSREKFTLDPEMSTAVTEAFIRLHEKGLVYRGNYMVNWSPHLQTAVSDLEVEYSEEQGTMYHFKYMVVQDSENGTNTGIVLSDGEFIPVATTRPETILGDAAVCVHPEDKRYRHLIGRKVRVPLCDRDIPVIGDSYVDRDFGTGALKITPAHDINDYELGKRHNLPLINVMNKDASINHLGGRRYAGLTREKCRDRIWSDIVAAGLAVESHQSAKGPGTLVHMQRVPRSQRGGEVIEPMVSPQWFVRTEGMAARAVQAVRGGEIAILPARFEKVWYNWLENIHDWCISRQLWWGHRIPVYYIIAPAAGPAATREEASPYIVARSLEEAQSQAMLKYGAGTTVVQDEDVLDTWFSSGLWPFATVGWPQQEAKDLERFYPASVLETGYDILFFWVARMVMMALELTDQVPFHTIYLHGLVRDAEGQKMSKTKGNVLDPLDVIAQHGSDALRYALVTGSAPGNDIPLAMEKIESARNFANKLWNAGKFMQNCMSGLLNDPAALSELSVRGPMDVEELDSLAIPERFIVSRCHVVAQEATAALEAHSFADAGRLVHDFLWDELADWYIEASKVRMRPESAGGCPTQQQQTRRVLVYVWDTALRLLHPYMPFLTETLWQQLPHVGESIMVSDWPIMQQQRDVLPVDGSAVKIFGTLQALVRSIRNARAEYAVDAGRKIPCVLMVHDPIIRDFLCQEKLMFAMFARVHDEQLQILSTEDYQTVIESAGACVHLVVEEGVEAFLPQSGLLDPVKEVQRLSKQSEKLVKDMQVLRSRLASPGFIDQAPTKIVTETRMKLADIEEQLKVIKSSIDSLR